MREYDVAPSVTNIQLNRLEEQATHKKQPVCKNAIIKLMYYYNFKFSETGHRLERQRSSEKSFGDLHKITQLFIRDNTIHLVRGTTAFHERPYREKDVELIYDNPIDTDDILRRLEVPNESNSLNFLFFGSLALLMAISFSLYQFHTHLHWVLQSALILCLPFVGAFFCFTVSLFRIKNYYRLMFDSTITELSLIYDDIQKFRDERIMNISVSYAYDNGITPVEAAKVLNLDNKSLYELDIYDA